MYMKGKPRVEVGMKTGIWVDIEALIGVGVWAQEMTGIGIGMLLLLVKI